MRDTPGGEIIRDNLTAFYSKARYQIINNGGMNYQFVGDQAIGLFGLPDHATTSSKAYDDGPALGNIGRSVSQQWQRHIDREQTPVGLHVGIAIGICTSSRSGPSAACTSAPSAIASTSPRA